MSDDYLKHYGVLGMKWGISRSKEVRGAKKAYKEHKRNLGSKIESHINNALKDHKNLEKARRDAVRNARKTGDPMQVRRVKEHFQNEFNKQSKKFDEGTRKLNKEYDKMISDHTNNVKSAKEAAANRLYRDGSSARNKRIANASLGKSLVQTFLMGSYGAKKYNQYRSEGQSKSSSAVKGVAANAANHLTLGALKRRDKRIAKKARL